MLTPAVSNEMMSITVIWEKNRVFSVDAAASVVSFLGLPSEIFMYNLKTQLCGNIQAFLLRILNHV